MLNFSPTDAAFGKNPGQLEPLEVVHPDRDPEFLAKVVQSIKDRLNALTADQAEAQKVLEGWRTRIAGMGSADDFNGALAEVKAAPKAAQAMFADAAKVNGLVWDKAAGKYAEAVAA